METAAKNKAYWRKNLQYLGILLGIWFITSYLCSVVFVEQLDKIRIGGCPLGFYFAPTSVHLDFRCADLRLRRVDEPFRSKISDKR